MGLRMTDAEKVLQPNNQTHLWCATCYGWWPKPEGCPHHQDDAEKVREGPLAVLADVLFYDPADRKRLEAALDSILTELAEAKAVVDEYVAQGPTDREAREMFIEEHNRAVAAEERAGKQKERAESIALRMGARIQELEAALETHMGVEATLIDRIQELEAALRNIDKPMMTVAFARRIARQALPGDDA